MLEFSAAYRRHWAFVCRALSRQRVAPADLDDIAQEVFVVLWRKLGEETDERALRSWLFQTARRIAANHRRGRRRHARKIAALPAPSTSPTPEDHAVARARLRRIEGFVDALDPCDRLVFRLAQIEHAPGRVVARRLGVKLHVAYARMHELRAQVDELLEEPPGERRRAWLLWVWWPRLLPVAAALVVLGLAPSGRSDTPEPIELPPASEAAYVPVVAASIAAYGFAPPSQTHDTSPAIPRSPRRTARRARDVGPIAAASHPQPPPLVVPLDVAPRVAVKWIPRPARARARSERDTRSGSVRFVDAHERDTRYWSGHFVVEHDRPLVGARVLCRVRTGIRRRCPHVRHAPRTDARGRVRLGPFAPGTYELVAMPAGASSTAAEATVVTIAP
jgi:RNA polymerase sigma-70 factor (ECF subfamily)